MDKDKKEFAGWWLFTLGLFILTAVVFTWLRFAGYFASTFVERKVFENSFQYSEARKTEIATFEAQLAEIQRKLSNPELDKTMRNNLEAQASALNIQLSVARNK